MSTPSRPDRRRFRASSWLVLAASPALLATLLASLGHLHFAADLLTHFPLPCLLTLLPAAALLAVCRRPGWAVLFALGAALAGFRLWPQCLGAPPGPGPGPVASLPVACANLRFTNLRCAELLSQIEAEQPDLLVLSELWPEAWRELEPGLTAWPHRLVHPLPGCFGIALLSKLPLTEARVVALGQEWTPGIVAKAEHPSGPIGILAAHAPPPGLARQSAERDRSLAAIPALLTDLPPRRLVLGDLNATPWSTSFRQLVQSTGLADSTRGAGLQGSWPNWLPGPLRIPIDHILVSPGIGVESRHLGTAFGSDHLPVFGVLALPAAQGH